MTQKKSNSGNSGSLILQTSLRYLSVMLLLLSVLLLFRGHNAPGGGFVGGLMAASALILHMIAYDVRKSRLNFCLRPQVFIGLGFLFVFSSGLFGLVRGEAFLKGKWTPIHLPFMPNLDLGTPLLFDLGVYFVVLGVTFKIIFSLMEEYVNNK